MTLYGCASRVVTPTLQIRPRQRAQGTARLRVSEPGIKSCVYWTPDSVCSVLEQDRGRDLPSSPGWAKSSLQDILSCQECHVTGQRAQSVMNFLEGGRACLQGQSSCGQRGRVRGGVIVSHVGWLFGMGRSQPLGFWKDLSWSPGLLGMLAPHPAPILRGFLGHCSVLGGSARMQKRPGVPGATLPLSPPPPIQPPAGLAPSSPPPIPPRCSLGTAWGWPPVRELASPSVTATPTLPGVVSFGGLLSPAL